MLRQNLTQNTSFQHLYQAVELVGPRVYTLDIGDEPEKATVFVIGCQGNGQQAQHDVARIMDNAPVKPDIVLVLGDNLYDDGATSPLDPQIDEYFYKIYDDAKLKNQLHGSKFFVILGNHDENLHRKARYKKMVNYSGPQGRDAGINQVAHTYATSWKQRANRPPISEDKDPGEELISAFEDYTVIDTKKKIEIFSQDILHVNELDKWNMPYFYYSIIIGDTQIFCLDSNSYASDFVELHQHPDDFATPDSRNRNQAAWLAHEYKNAIAAGRRVMLAQHHPLYTSGKRADPAHYDTCDYISDANLLILKRILDCKTDSYNELLCLLFQYQKMEFEILFAAHDHCLQYYNEKSLENPHGLCQITSGGGGGDLQKRTHFFGYEHVGCYLKNNGYVSISFAMSNPKEYIIDFHSTAHHHLRFNQLSHFALCEPIDNQKLRLIRSTILTSVDDYLSLLLSALLFKNNKQAEYKIGSFFSRFTSTISNIASHLVSYDNFKREDIDDIHNITAYLNQVSLADIATTIDKLHELFDKLTAKPLTDPSNPFSAIRIELDAISDIHDDRLMNIEIDKIVDKISRYFHSLTILNHTQAARSLVDFAFTLTDTKHPFRSLVDANLATMLHGLSLDDLHQANLATTTIIPSTTLMRSIKQ